MSYLVVRHRNAVGLPKASHKARKRLKHKEKKGGIVPPFSQVLSLLSLWTHLSASRPFVVSGAVFIKLTRCGAC